MEQQTTTKEWKKKWKTKQRQKVVLGKLGKS